MAFVNYSSTAACCCGPCYYAHVRSESLSTHAERDTHALDPTSLSHAVQLHQWLGS